MLRIYTTAAGLCLLCGCAGLPEFYAPPPQRQPVERELLVRDQPLLDMGNPTVERYFVSDIDRGPQAASWRWTGQHPTIRIPLKSTESFQYLMEFAIADSTFKDTGPVTITYKVNDRVLDRVRYDTPGRRTYEQRVPPALLNPLGDNILTADLDKTWRAPADGHELGVILLRFGLTQ